MAVRFCTKCGSKVIPEVPLGDNRERDVCARCKHIEYKNPRNVVGCLATRNSKLLMCRRGIEPGYGLWTLPAGYMEIGESLTGCAKRETSEEANAEVEVGPLFAVVDLIHIEEVHFYFKAEMTSDHFAPGEETLETKLFSVEDIPWDSLAFSSVRFALRKYFHADQSGLHHAIAPIPQSCGNRPGFIDQCSGDSPAYFRYER